MSRATHTVFTAQLLEHFARGRALIEDYQRWLGIDLCFQNFASELDQIASMYGPPSGALILAQMDEKYVGCVGIRALEPQIAEMKRMYVPEAFRGLGIGRALAEHSIAVARNLGYKRMRLDTVPRLRAARSIYFKLGFVAIPAYRHNPDPETLFLELEL